MTATDDELIALCDAATPGPWEAWDSIYVGMKAAIVAPGLDPLVTVAEVRTNYDDAKFLAAASPERVKALVMRVRELEAWIANPPKHHFWRPGEPDCPKDIKGANGELHTMRCRSCGLDDPREDICRAAYFKPDGVAP